MIKLGRPPKFKKRMAISISLEATVLRLVDALAYRRSREQNKQVSRSDVISDAILVTTGGKKS